MVPIKKHYIGEIINNITILDKKLENKRTYYYCKCKCGKEFWTRVDTLKTIVSCGCKREEKVKKNYYKLFKGHLEKNIVDSTNLSVITKNEPNSLNTSGHKGVRWDKERGCWYTYITFQKKTHFLGRYINKEDAVKARKEAEEKLHKEFLRKLENK